MANPQRPCTANNPCLLVLVEDEAVFQDLFKRWVEELAAARFAIRSVPSLDGLAAALSNWTNVDAVILDLGLANSDGLSTLGRALEITHAEVPVIVVTGGPDFEEEAIELGAAGYSGKAELNFKDLLRLVRVAIAHQRFLSRWKETVRAEAARLETVAAKLSQEGAGLGTAELRDAITGLRDLAATVK